MKPVSKCDSASPPSHARFLPALTLVLCFALSLNALASYSSLQPEQVEEAYWLGRTSNLDELTAFLKQYQHDFPYPQDRPTAYVQSIEFQTPYEQIVSRSHMGGARYSRDQAIEAYQANPRLVIVRVITALRINYTGPAPPDNGYQVVVSQGNPIEPRKATNTVTCDPYSATPYPLNTNCTGYTREILLSFDAAQFGLRRATVKVSLPEGQSLETSFNLNKLK